MLFKQKLGQSNVPSLVECVSRFTVLLKNPNKRTKPVMGKVVESLTQKGFIYASSGINFNVVRVKRATHGLRSEHGERRALP